VHVWRVPLVLTAAAVLLTGCTSAAGNHGTAGAAVHATKTVSLGDRDSIRVPSTWTVTQFHGLPATVVFPILFLSSRPLPPECPVGGRGRKACETQNWFAPGWRTPRDGVLVMWLESEIPSTTDFHIFGGRRIHVDHHAAKIRTTVPSACAPGAAREADATVRAWGATHSYELLDMTACFGPDAPRVDRSAVMAMLRSLRVRSSN
jgi:hypothetical protein